MVAYSKDGQLIEGSTYLMIRCLGRTLIQGERVFEGALNLSITVSNVRVSVQLLFELKVSGKSEKLKK